MIGNKDSLISTIGVFLIVFFSFFVSAGVGIKWDRESALVGEGEGSCLTYGVYNPWPEETWVTIEVTEPLKEVLEIQDTESTLIPHDTSSGAAIPVEFCFEIPERIYEKDCWIGNSFVCEKKCLEQQQVYDGDVIVKSVPPPADTPGGSVATMAVSAPLRLKVDCIPHPRNYTLIYIFIAAISVLIVFMVLRKKYGKSKEERIKDKMKALKEEMKSMKKK